LAISSSLYIISFTAVALALFHQPPLLRLHLLSTSQWGIILGISILSTILPMTLILAGLQKLKSSQAALITMLEPVTAAVAAGFLLRESFSPMQIAGALLVILCLSFSILRAA